MRPSNDLHPSHLRCCNIQAYSPSEIFVGPSGSKIFWAESINWWSTCKILGFAKIKRTSVETLRNHTSSTNYELWEMLHLLGKNGNDDRRPYTDCNLQSYRQAWFCRKLGCCPSNPGPHCTNACSPQQCRHISPSLLDSRLPAQNNYLNSGKQLSHSSQQWRIPLWKYSPLVLLSYSVTTFQTDLGIKIARALLLQMMSLPRIMKLLPGQSSCSPKELAVKSSSPNVSCSLSMMFCRLWQPTCQDWEFWDFFLHCRHHVSAHVSSIWLWTWVATAGFLWSLLLRRCVPLLAAIVAPPVAGPAPPVAFWAGSGDSEDQIPGCPAWSSETSPCPSFAPAPASQHHSYLCAGYCFPFWLFMAESNSSYSVVKAFLTAEPQIQILMTTRNARRLVLQML